MSLSTRLREFPISIEFLQEIMTEGWEIGGGATVRCVRGLPHDAKFEYATSRDGSIALVFSHPSWEMVDVIAGPIPMEHVLMVRSTQPSKVSNERPT